MDRLQTRQIRRRFQSIIQMLLRTTSTCLWQQSRASAHVCTWGHFFWAGRGSREVGLSHSTQLSNSWRNVALSEVETSWCNWSLQRGAVTKTWGSKSSTHLQAQTFRNQSLDGTPTQKCHTCPRQQAQTLSLFSLVIFEVRIIETKPETEKRAAMLAPRTNLSDNKTSTDKMWKWFQLEFSIYDTKLQLKSYKKGFAEAKLIVPSVDGVSSPSSVSHIKPLMRKINLLGEEESSETFLHDRRDMWPNTEQHNNPMTFGMEWIRQCSHKHSQFFQHN